MKLAYWIAILIVLGVVIASFGTGIYLMFTNRPTLEYAYNDILALRDVTTLGINREFHGWLAVVLPITVITYLVVGVIVTVAGGDFAKSRTLGLVSLVVALALLGAAWFTAHNMQYNQLAMWAETAGSNMSRATSFLGNDVTTDESRDTSAHFELSADGRSASEAAINRGYVFHCVVLPTVFVSLLMVSIWTLRPKNSMANQMVSDNAG